jgi:hypothetical protein
MSREMETSSAPGTTSFDSSQTRSRNDSLVSAETSIMPSACNARTEVSAPGWLGTLTVPLFSRLTGCSASISAD